MMTFDVEVLLKGTNEVVAETVTYDGPEPAGWTDPDVREGTAVHTTGVRPGQQRGRNRWGRGVAARLSWIVTDADPGVAIAIEIPSGAVASGPFDLPTDELTQMIARVISPGAQTSDVH